MTKSREDIRGVTRLGNRFVNWWLVRDTEGSVVVDAGLPRHLSQLQGVLSETSASFGDISACLITHADIDHIGVAKALRCQYHVPVIVHPDDIAAMAGRLREVPEELLANMSEPYLRDAAASYVRDGGLQPQFLSAVSTFADGDELEVPGRPVVIHCPGHTPESVALFFPGKGLLFTGDALVTVNIVSGVPGPQLLPAFDNDDDDQALASLERLAETGARYVLSGHGEPWSAGIAHAVADATRARR